MKRIISLFLLFVLAFTLQAKPLADTLSLGQLKAALREEPGKAGGTHRMYPFGPYEYAPAPEGYRPVYISHYGRHGARYVTKASKYDDVAAMLEKGRKADALTPLGKELYDSYMAVYPLLKGHEGDLTLKGQAQHRNLASRMAAAYPEVFRGGHVDARASVSPRAIISMMSFCKELSEENPDLKIDFASDATDLPFTVLQSGEFPSWDQLYGLLQTPEFGLSYHQAIQNAGFDSQKYLLKLFTDPAPVKECGKPEDLVSSLFEVATSTECLDFPVELPQIFTEEELFQMWEISNLYAVIMFKANHYTKGIIPAFAWPLMENILKRADEDLASGDVDVRLRFGHDTIVGPIMGLLGIGDWGEDAGADLSLWKYRFQGWEIPMASNLQFIFYRNDAGNVLVRLMYNEKDQVLPLKDQSLAPYYNWADFKAHYTKVSTEARKKLKAIEAEVNAAKDEAAEPQPVPAPAEPGKISFVSNPAMPLPAGIHFYYNTETEYDGRFSYMKPAWFIYPDKACNREEAEALVDRMGLNGPLKDYVSMVAILSPINGKAYDKEKDFAMYQTLINQIRVFTNLKVIGIGEGATFVNENIAPLASEVAGIVSVGGKAPKKIEGKATVPVYISGKEAAKAARAYIVRNKALPTQNGKTLKVYRNAQEPLLQVVVNTKTASLEEVMADAWERLLSVNYRCSNLGHTAYMGATMGQWGDYELEPYPMFDRLGITRNKVVDTLYTFNHKPNTYLWYEYIPASVKEASARNVPLVVLLHGHNNDPRTQAETSGFLELAAQKGFMVAELEWQGKEGLFDYMGDHGIEAVVRHLLEKYPQLDPSRVYAEGLSAGGFTTTALGVHKTQLFAAVGAHSGGIHIDSQLNLGFPFMDQNQLWAEARFKSGKVRMPYFSIIGTADDAVPYHAAGNPNDGMVTSAWRLYQTLNGLPVSGPSDWDAYPVFGLPLENRHRVETLKHHAMEVGDMLNAAGHPVIRLVVIENFGHWNFVPGAAQMWEFFSHWSRNPETFESEYHE